jgi:hypothetical protein
MNNVDHIEEWIDHSTEWLEQKWADYKEITGTTDDDQEYDFYVQMYYELFK